MQVCFPVGENEGLASAVYNHFGSAPFFIVVDTATNGFTVLDNQDRLHAHGACNPLKALQGRQIDAVIVGGIGAGALGKLHQIGIKVFRAKSPAIGENLALLASGELPEYALQHACGGHGRGGSCSH